MKRFLGILLVLSSGTAALQAQGGSSVPTERSGGAAIEFVGAECPDGTDLFLLEGVPAKLNAGGVLFSRLQEINGLYADTLCIYQSDSRYLAYIKVNRQFYGYWIDEERIGKAYLSTLVSFPMISRIFLNAANAGAQGVKLLVDFTLCIYDRQSDMVQIMHPFLYAAEQPKKELRKIQIMQPEGVAIDYPLVDEMQTALAAEYAKICREYGLTTE